MKDYEFTRVKNISRNNLKIYIDENKEYIYKKYDNKNSYNQIYYYYNNIKNFSFVPKMEFLENNIIKEEYCKPLYFYNKPLDYIPQMFNIYITLKKNKVFHNDIQPRHIMLKNNKIMLIDWDMVTVNKKKFNNYSRPLHTFFYFIIDYIVVILLTLIFIYFKK